MRSGNEGSWRGSTQPGTVVPGDYVVGIDPGLSGAIAILPCVRPPEPIVHDMPVFGYSPGGFVKTAVDLAALRALLAPYGVIGDVRAVLERVSAFPGQGVGSMFSLGMSFWGVAGVLAGLRIPMTLVEPKAWKGHYGLDKDKQRSIELARKMFPNIQLTRKKDHNRAEALLIARYGMEKT